MGMTVIDLNKKEREQLVKYGLHYLAPQDGWLTQVNNTLVRFGNAKGRIQLANAKQEVLYPSDQLKQIRGIDPVIVKLLKYVVQDVKQELLL